MYKILLAEQCDVIIRQVMEALDDRWEVRVCSDGNLVKQMLADFQPDVMIIDYILPGKNAISVLSECFPELPLLIIVLGSQVNPFVRNHLSRWGVDYVFEMPADNGLLKTILRSPEIFSKIAVKRTVEHLRVLGVQAGRVGYTYLLLSIPYISEDPTLHLHNELYEYVSKHANAEERNIEHAIRTAISSAWKNRIHDIWSKYFPVNEAGEIACPSIKDFVYALAQKIT